MPVLSQYYYISPDASIIPALSQYFYIFWHSHLMPVLFQYYPSIIPVLLYPTWCQGKEGWHHRSRQSDRFVCFFVGCKFYLIHLFVLLSKFKLCMLLCLLQIYLIYLFIPLTIVFKQIWSLRMLLCRPQILSFRPFINSFSFKSGRFVYFFAGCKFYPIHLFVPLSTI